MLLFGLEIMLTLENNFWKNLGQYYTRYLKCLLALQNKPSSGLLIPLQQTEMRPNILQASLWKPCFLHCNIIQPPSHSYNTNQQIATGSLDHFPAE